MNTRVVISEPKDTFVVYDDKVKGRALFAVRYGTREDDSVYGQLFTTGEMFEFDDGEIGEEVLNPFGKIPIVEYILNKERIGLFENITGQVETYNKIIAEKANDVDAFAEAYMVIIGAEVDDEGVYRIRDDRLINLYGTDDAKEVLVQFLTKPTADASQENLLNRLEKLIYQQCMVANISDENFGGSSGTALAYRIQSMSNLAQTFERKLFKSMSKRYKLFCTLSTNIGDQNAWRGITYTSTRNVPKNQKEEAETAKTLIGVVSEETLLKGLSIVDDVKAEMERKANEENARTSIVKDLIYPDGTADG